MVSRLAPFQHAFVQRLSELGIAYGGSPIIEGLGKRYFDDSMRDGIKSKFLLVVGDNEGVTTIETAKQLCGSFGDIVEFRLAEHSGIMLVRPDGYIAYERRGHDGVPVLASLRSVLERQTNRSPQKREAA